MTNTDLVRDVRKNNRNLMELLACPYPDGDGAQLGYDGEVRALEVEGDELLEECDHRGMDRRAALLGAVRWAT